MAESAAHLVDQVIPRVPVRQWVLSFPISLAFIIATVLIVMVLPAVRAGRNDITG